MRSLAIALTGLMALCAPFAAPRAGVVRIADSDLVLGGMAFPQRIGTFVRGGTRNFEPDSPGLGVSVAYHRPDVTASAFVYDRRLTTIPDGPRSDLVRGEFDLALEDIAESVRQRRYQSWQLKETGEFRSHGIGYRFARLTLGRDRGASDSYLFVTGVANRFLKVRITAPAGTFGTEDAKGFVALLSESLGR